MDDFTETLPSVNRYSTNESPTKELIRSHTDENSFQKLANVPAENSLRLLASRYLAESVDSPLTIKSKKIDLKRFILHFEIINGHSDVTKIMPIDIKYHLDEMEKQSFAPATRNKALAAIKSFCAWLMDEGIIPKNPALKVRALRIVPQPREGLTDIEMHRLRKALDLSIATPKTKISSELNFRNKVMLELLDASGLRIEEVLSLKMFNLGTGRDQKKLVNVKCKGAVVRTIRIKKSVINLIHLYIKKYRGDSKSDYIFLNRYGNRLSRNGVAYVFGVATRMANATLPDNENLDFAPHDTRRRHATKCREKVDIQFAADRLGHSSLDTIGRYTTNQAKEERILEEL